MFRTITSPKAEFHPNQTAKQTRISHTKALCYTLDAHSMHTIRFMGSPFGGAGILRKPDKSRKKRPVGPLASYLLLPVRIN
jgi:hypothetical protein